MAGVNSGKVLIGTSGYSYNDWLGNFYPQFCSPKDFLRFYASVFKTVEIDATFYKIPTAETVKKWRQCTPEEFVFAAKFPQIVTHEGDIASRLSAARAFIDIMQNLETKLGPLLLQFPYSFKPDEHQDILTALVEAMPEKIKISVEVRNKKWLSDSFYRLLADKKIALCLIDHPWMPRRTEFTSHFAYIRFLGDHKKIESDYSYERLERTEELQWWKDLIEEFSRSRGEVYAYFNNHYSGHSPTTARRLLKMLDTAKMQSL